MMRKTDACTGIERIKEISQLKERICQLEDKETVTGLQLQRESCHEIAVQTTAEGGLGPLPVSDMGLHMSTFFPTFYLCSLPSQGWLGITHIT